MSLEETIKLAIQEVIREELRPIREAMAKSQTKETGELLTRKEVARRLHLNPITVSTMVREGRLRASRIGGQLRFSSAEFAEDFAKLNIRGRKK